ncbi:hypothetical protein JW916_14235 [Candidatus Sumerlaeota bacterium]|nr:hypothetical protein [Candidatus Sumerlaeota bacterium]
MKRSRPPVLILFNSPRADASQNGFSESDAGVLAEVEAVGAALRKTRTPFRSVGVKRLRDAARVLARATEPVVFNLVESFHDRPEEMNYVPALCSAFGKGCTGCDTTSLTLSLDKWRTNAVLKAAGLPVPAGVLVPIGEKIPKNRLPKPPLIVKPVAADASEGIHADASLFPRTGPKLRAAVRAIHDRFGQPALIEAFFGTREINVSVFERAGRAEVVGIAEIDFSAFGPERPTVVDYAAKWQNDSFEYHHTPRLLPAPLRRGEAARIERIALDAWRAVGCRDYARVDLRMDSAGEVAVLEINTNPDIAPDAGFAAALEHAGIPYREFVATVVRNALDRVACERMNVRTRERVKDRGFRDS